MTRSRLGLLLVLGMLSALLPIGAAAPAAAATGDLVIAGVVDGPLPGGLPKAIELYVVNGIADLSEYGIGSANNGSGSDGEEFTLPSVAASPGDFIYIASESIDFAAFFGFTPDHTSSAANINGDDAIELFHNGVVVDIFGDINVDGTGQPWEHLDGWAYRIADTGQDGGTFVLGNWTFSGPNALDGETTNATAASPFPIGTYTAGMPPVPIVVVNEIMQNPAAVSDGSGEWFELFNPTSSAIDIEGWTLADGGSDSHVITNGGPLLVPAGGYLVLGNNTDPLTNGGVPVAYSYGSSWFLSNGADEVVLSDGSLAEVDRVEYDGGSVFPDPTGSSMALIDAALNNNDGSNWCEAGTAFGDGDLGSPGAPNDCALPSGPLPVKIHEVQGSGSASPIVGTEVVVEGVVVGDFQDGAQFNGFHIQEEDFDADSDPSTSEGVFVYDPGFTIDVNVGDVVEVVGTVVEFNALTEIGSVTSVAVKSSGASVTPATVTLPVTASSDFEKYEGMAVLFPQSLTISEYFNFDRFGEIVLTTDRQFQPTAVYEPGSPGAADAAVAHALARITLDDGRSGQNPDPALHPAGGVFDLTNRFRGGDLITNLTGVMDFAFGKYKVQPTSGADYTAANPRPASHDAVGGTLEVATFNVLNYFTTLDGSGSICGPDGDQGCRGADNADEFNRQRTKIVAAIVAMDSDVVGVMEIENHPTDAALADLVSGLNDATAPGTYEYVDAGVVGPDVIKVGLIYKPGSVSISGPSAILDTPGFLDPNNLGEAKNRAALAQTFTQNGTGEAFTVVVNHLKSKGSPCGPGDDDTEAGSCNLTRTLAAQALADWLVGDPTGSADSDFLIIGDLNAYDKEDPIDALIAGGYSDLVAQYVGENAYSFVFSGQWGYLDYAMANSTLASQVTGATIWHINSDEPDILDYDTSFKKAAQDALYEPNAYRSSDHDPVIVGLTLDQTAPVVQAGLDKIWASRRVGAFVVDYACVDAVDTNPSCDGDINGIPVDDGQRVLLIKARGSAWSHTIGSTLLIKDSSFLLTVVGSDSSGNSDEATAEPQFRTGRWWRAWH